MLTDKILKMSLNTNAVSLSNLYFLIYNIVGVGMIINEVPYYIGEVMITLGVVYTLWSKYKQGDNILPIVYLMGGIIMLFLIAKFSFFF